VDVASREDDVDVASPSAARVSAEMVRDLAPVVVGRVDREERLLDLGGGLLGRLGYRREDWIGRCVGDMVTDETTLRLLRRALAGEPAAATTTLNGRPWLVAARPVHDDAGAVTGAVSMLTFADVGRLHTELTAQQLINEQLAALVELSSDFVAVADLDGIVTYVNRAGRELVGLETDEQTLGRPTDDYFTEHGRRLSQEIEDSVRDRGSWEGESELRHFGGEPAIPVSVSSYLVTRSTDGMPLALATVQRDLRARRAAERAAALRIQEQRSLAELGRQGLTLPLAQLMDEAVQLVVARYRALSSGVMRLSPDARTSRMVSSSQPDWVGVQVDVQRDSLTGLAVLDNTLTCSDDLAADPRFSVEGPTERLQVRSGLCSPIPGSDGPWGIVGVSAGEPRHWSDDDIAFVESVASVLGAAVRRHDLEAQLQHQALHDPLTGLPNRALVLDRIDNALGRSARRGTLLAVLLLDVDDFKSVNDALGHATGDRLLADLAGRLRSVVRDGDTVARLGGDEFVVVCEDVASEDDVAFVAEALLEACGAGVVVGERRLGVSASVGVALAVGGEASTTGMLGEADIAMYRAKRDRPGTYRIFDEAMRGDVLGRINVAGELRVAVRAERIDLVFQPIVDLASGRVVALEALARWTNESGQQIPPDVFVPVAEETGMIGDLGRLVLRDAARQAAGWQDLGEIGIRVNASAHELRSRTYVDQVGDLLAESGLNPTLLGIEITESVLIDEDKVTQDNLTRLRDSGITLLIDDFGTGYSSLSYLQRFPVVDVLKVDRSFLGAGTRGEAVVQAVVGLGEAFDLQVCAEGVETPEQHARVVELGCDFAQGYLLGRPVPGSEVRGLLAGWRPVLPG
jgi:diguanylate cyclase (GGDEF)-like protein/PAS domain S-box-containing protein